MYWSPPDRALDINLQKHPEIEQNNCHKSIPAFPDGPRGKKSHFVRNPETRWRGEWRSAILFWVPLAHFRLQKCPSDNKLAEKRRNIWIFWHVFWNLQSSDSPKSGPSHLHFAPAGQNVELRCGSEGQDSQNLLRPPKSRCWESRLAKYGRQNIRRRAGRSQETPPNWGEHLKSTKSWDLWRHFSVRRINDCLQIEPRSSKWSLWRLHSQNRLGGASSEPLVHNQTVPGPKCEHEQCRPTFADFVIRRWAHFAKSPRRCAFCDWKSRKKTFGCSQTIWILHFCWKTRKTQRYLVFWEGQGFNASTERWLVLQAAFLYIEFLDQVAATGSGHFRLFGEVHFGWWKRNLRFDAVWLGPLVFSFSLSIRRWQREDSLQPGHLWQHIGSFGCNIGQIQIEPKRAQIRKFWMVAQNLSGHFQQPKIFLEFIELSEWKFAWPKPDSLQNTDPGNRKQRGRYLPVWAKAQFLERHPRNPAPVD